MKVTSLNFKDLFCTINLQYDSAELALFATCAWLIWHVRNRLQHESNCSNPTSIALQAMDLMEEYMNQQHLSSYLVQSTGPSLRILMPSDPGILKINTNVSFTDGKIGIGILIRNDLSIPLMAKSLP